MLGACSLKACLAGVAFVYSTCMNDTAWYQVARKDACCRDREYLTGVCERRCAVA